MEILINNKAVVLPEDFSMSYDIENRFFSVKTEGWSLDFELPLRGCPRNISIFGAVHHKNVRLSAITYSCVVRHGVFEKHGIAVPISVNESSISLQFLSGRSEINYVSPLESTYIRNISLPQTLVKSEIACLANAQHDIDDGHTETCLPWVNNYSGNIQNHLDLNTPHQDPVTGNNFFYFDDDVTEVSCQIYLVELTRRILVSIGYTVDLTAWYNSVWKYLLVWNAVPAAWGQHNFNIALPKWTIMEFIEQIELLTGFDFDIDEQNKNITVKTSKSVITAAGVVRLDDIEESFEMEVGDNSLEFREGVELKYADRGDKEWDYECCTTAIKKMEDDGFLDDTPVHYYDWSLPSTHNRIVTDYSHLDQDIQFIEERGRYFKQKVYDVTSQNGTDGQGNTTTTFAYWAGFMFMNQFGATSADDESKFKELKIVPARIIHTVDGTLNDRVNGYCWDYVAMDPGEYEANESAAPTTIDEAVAYKDRVDKYIEKEEDVTEYLNMLYVTFWKKDFAYTDDINGTPFSLHQNAAQFGIRDRQRHPMYGERYMYHYMGTMGPRYWPELKFRADMTLSLRAPEHSSFFPEPVDGTRKYTFKWLSKTIPDVKSLYVINGRRFYCSVIKTKWTINGMSEELEGEFYEII